MRLIYCRMGVAYTVAPSEIVNLVSFMFWKITESHQQLRSLQCCFSYTTTITKIATFNSIPGPTQLPSAVSVWTGDWGSSVSGDIG